MRPAPACAATANNDMGGMLKSPTIANGTPCNSSISQKMCSMSRSVFSRAAAFVVPPVHPYTLNIYNGNPPGV
eukprot:11602775-Alexandrium_andersonii.AAC.1